MVALAIGFLADFIDFVEAFFIDFLVDFIAGFDFVAAFFVAAFFVAFLVVFIACVDFIECIDLAVVLWAVLEAAVALAVVPAAIAVPVKRNAAATNDAINLFMCYTSSLEKYPGFDTGEGHVIATYLSRQKVRPRASHPFPGVNLRLRMV